MLCKLKRITGSYPKPSSAGSSSFMRETSSKGYKIFNGYHKEFEKYTIMEVEKL